MSPIKVSEWIYPLQKLGSTGHVHSVFERSFNVDIAGHLVNVTNFPEYLSSYGMTLPAAQFEQLFPYIQVGNLVKIKADRLVFYSRHGVQTVDLSAVSVISLQVRDCTLTDVARKRGIHVLEKRALATKIGMENHTLANEHWEQLTTKKPIEIQKKRETLTYLIGRGKGLTPSGDDILTAYLAVLQVRKDPRFSGWVEALAQIPWSTTAISQAYLSGVLEGYVNSFVYQFIRDLQEQKPKELLEEDIDRLMAIGHSSGKDMSFGLLLGLT